MTNADITTSRYSLTDDPILPLLSRKLSTASSAMLTAPDAFVLHSVQSSFTV